MAALFRLVLHMVLDNLLFIYILLCTLFSLLICFMASPDLVTIFYCQLQFPARCVDAKMN